jgi:predicted GIY-YIG superfamily endonuclease
MSTWNTEHQQGEGEKALERYERKDLTNSRQFTRELHAINSNQTLTVLDKYRYKKQLMRTVFIAKQQEINHHLESFENYLLARKDVEAKSITLEAQKAILVLEKQQLEMMKAMGLSHSDEISETLIAAGNMLTGKLLKVEESDMAPEIKASTIKHIRKVWEKTNNRIMESVDTYMDELYEKERGMKK